MTPFTDRPIRPGTVAAAAERYGFDMLCMGEHPFYPGADEHALPGRQVKRPDGISESPTCSWCWRWRRRPPAQSAWPAACAWFRSAIRFFLAKAAASLDYFSGGRFSLGVGTGWVREEYEILGADFDHRWEVLREYVSAMKEMWTKPEAEFHGRWVRFPAIRLNPKPAQQPHPPVIICAGESPRYNRSLRYTVSIGNGWMPLFNSRRQAARVVRRDGQKT